MGLLKRLTTVGSTRREEEPAKLQPAAPREPKLRQPAPEARRLAAQDPQLYAPRRGQLDEHGRLRRQRARPRKTISWRFRRSFAGKPTDPSPKAISRPADRNILRPPA